MTPKFEVGEVVILQSEDRPDLNGEYEVISVFPGERFDDGIPGYELTVECKPGSATWCETSLRKKHLPGTLSFRDLMQTLKDPSKCLNV